MKSVAHELLIVADDLTGACDAAAPFAPATVCVPSYVPDSRMSTVIAFSTETRDHQEPEITRRMQALAETAGDAQLIFKKIDSTLRGNVQAEIAAAMAAFHCTTAVITPAFPDMGRTVQNQHLLIHGVLTMHAGENILDAVTNQDLDRIVETGLTLPGRVLWAGSAGLAAALARHLRRHPKSATTPHIKGPIAFCIGSNHPATQAQQAELKHHHPDAMVLTVRRGRTTAEEVRRALPGAAALFITGGDTASAVLQAVGARSIAIQHEVVTGVPWGMLSGGIFDGCPVVTKSGGFGAPDTLVKVANFFTCRN